MVVDFRVSEAICIDNWIFFKQQRKITQDRRWNADKPSAALDPYIPTWLTTLPANQTCQLLIFFFKHWKEIVKSGTISGWTDEDQF